MTVEKIRHCRAEDVAEIETWWPPEPIVREVGVVYPSEIEGLVWSEEESLFLIKCLRDNWPFDKCGLNLAQIRVDLRGNEQDGDRVIFVSPCYFQGLVSNLGKEHFLAQLIGPNPDYNSDFSDYLYRASRQKAFQGIGRLGIWGTGALLTQKGFSAVEEQRFCLPLVPSEANNWFGDEKLKTKIQLAWTTFEINKRGLKCFALTRRRILAKLAENRATAQQLVRAVWPGEGHQDHNRNLYVQVNYLKLQLGAFGLTIETPGSGTAHRFYTLVSLEDGLS